MKLKEVTFTVKDDHGDEITIGYDNKHIQIETATGNFVTLSYREFTDIFQGIERFRDTFPSQSN